jgi:hypothetical protein
MLMITQQQDLIAEKSYALVKLYILLLVGIPPSLLKSTAETLRFFCPSGLLAARQDTEKTLNRFASPRDFSQQKNHAE